MSEPSIPPSHGHINLSRAGYAYQQAYTANHALFATRQQGAAAPAPTRTPTPRRRRPPRKSGLWLVRQAAQPHGSTHPTMGGFLQLPREFDAILALEHKAVTQVVLEVLRQTIGTPVYDQYGNTQRREWARISQRDFSRAGIMSKKDAAHGIEGALKQGLHSAPQGRGTTLCIQYLVEGF
jgi:hypothetical protein